jgi:hypothetical protein
MLRDGSLRANHPNNLMLSNAAVEYTSDDVFDPEHAPIAARRRLRTTPAGTGEATLMAAYGGFKVIVQRS